MIATTIKYLPFICASSLALPIFIFSFLVTVNAGTGYVDALSRLCETVHCSHHYYLFDAERSRAKLLIPWQIKPFACPFFSPGTLNCHISVTLTRYRPKIADNQYFIFDITPGYLPKSERTLAGECPELSTDLPVHNPQKPLKINIISMSRRPIGGLFSLSKPLSQRADAPHKSPPNNPHQPKATHFPPSPSKGPFYVAKQCNGSRGERAVARAAEPGLRKVYVAKLLGFPFRLP